MTGQHHENADEFPNWPLSIVSPLGLRTAFTNYMHRVGKSWLAMPQPSESRIECTVDSAIPQILILVIAERGQYAEAGGCHQPHRFRTFSVGGMERELNEVSGGILVW